MIIPVVQFPTMSLRQKSEPVTELTQQLRVLASNMMHTIEHRKALGLAAIQCGAPFRMMVLSKSLGVPAVLIINPRVAEVSFTTLVGPETCLSVNNGATQVQVKRAKSIKMWGLNSFGDEIAYDVGGKAAIVMQRLIDLMDGKLIIDFAELIRVV